MPVEINPTTTPAVGQSSEGGNPAEPKLIAGKFKSIEEAVEKGYGGLEAGFHELSQTVSGLVKVMEQVVSQPKGVPIGQAGNAYDAYRTPQEDRIDPVAFVTNPEETLRKREEKLLNKVGEMVTNVIQGAQAVSDFKSHNPDLIEHERIVQAFMKDTDPRKSLTDRLAEAGQATRTYLAKVTGRAFDKPAAPMGSSYVEPAGSNPVAHSPAIPSNSPSEEAELIEYIAERNRNMTDHFGVVPAAGAK